MFKKIIWSIVKFRKLTSFLGKKIGAGKSQTCKFLQNYEDEKASKKACVAPQFLNLDGISRRRFNIWRYVWPGKSTALQHPPPLLAIRKETLQLWEAGLASSPKQFIPMLAVSFLRFSPQALPQTQAILRAVGCTLHFPHPINNPSHAHTSF